VKPMWVDPCGQFVALSGWHELPCLYNERSSAPVAHRSSDAMEA
jgi:hypothetical protein